MEAAGQCWRLPRSPLPVMWCDCGFTIIVQEAGIPIKLASSIGVAVDHRRRNRSLEGLQVQNPVTSATSSLRACAYAPAAARSSSSSAPLH